MTGLQAVLLEGVAEALEQDPKLALRIRTALGITQPSTPNVPLRLRDIGISIRTLRAAIRDGELKAAKVGREYVVAQADLDRWLQRHQVAPKPQEQPDSPAAAAQRALKRARQRGTLRVVGKC
jgi:excisionase family DNA binding protein